MQPTYSEEFQAAPRRTLDIEDYLGILRRHLGWIAGPALLGLVIAVVVAYTWQDTYVSTAVIRVVPPLIPSSYVATNINSDLSQRVNQMYQDITSRETLGGIVTRFDLYKKDRATKPMQDVVEQMRKSIRLGDVVPLSGSRRASAFRLSFSYSNRLQAQSVANELVGRFMSENQRRRAAQSINITQFLEDQLAAAKKNMEAIEVKLANFRSSHAGRLPEQLSMNQMHMNTLESRITNINNSINRIEQEKLLLESDLRSLKTQRASIVPPEQQAGQARKNEELARVDRRIAGYEAQLESWRQQYKDTWPDMRRLINEIELQKRNRERLLAEEEEERAAAEAAPEKPQSQPKLDRLSEREARQVDASIARIEVILGNKQAEIEGYKQAIEATNKNIAGVQARLQTLPAGELEYLDIVRDRTLAKQTYDDLNMKRASSEMAEQVERQNQGESLELLDQASLPSVPAQPKRPTIIGAGLMAGFVLGLFLAGAREAKDTSLKNLKDVRAYTQLPVLGSVPLLENNSVVRRRRRLAMLGWSTACLLGILIMTGAVLYYQSTKV